MDASYRTFFGFKKEPFASDLALNEILKTSELIEIKERFDYAIRIGAMALVTGDIGSGKSRVHHLLYHRLLRLYPGNV
jgi:type II secretory pathway predicted ATPase ExeA